VCSQSSALWPSAGAADVRTGVTRNGCSPQLRGRVVRDEGTGGRGHEGGTRQHFRGDEDVGLDVDTVEDPAKPGALEAAMGNPETHRLTPGEG
jgi:hypothetical protein